MNESCLFETKPAHTPLEIKEKRDCSYGFHIQLVAVCPQVLMSWPGPSTHSPLLLGRNGSWNTCQSEGGGRSCKGLLVLLAMIPVWSFHPQDQLWPRPPLTHWFLYFCGLQCDRNLRQLIWAISIYFILKTSYTIHKSVNRHLTAVSAEHFWPRKKDEKACCFCLQVLQLPRCYSYLFILPITKY